MRSRQCLERNCFEVGRERFFSKSEKKYPKRKREKEESESGIFFLWFKADTH